MPLVEVVETCDAARTREPDAAGTDRQKRRFNLERPKSVLQRGPVVLQPHEERLHWHSVLFETPLGAVPARRSATASAARYRRAWSSSRFLPLLHSASTQGTAPFEEDGISARVSNRGADQHLELVALPALIAQQGGIGRHLVRAR